MNFETVRLIVVIVVDQMRGMLRIAEAIELAFAEALSVRFAVAFATVRLMSDRTPRTRPATC